MMHTRETENFLLRLRQYSPGVIQQPHFHQHSSISVVLNGHVEEKIDGFRRRGRSLSTVIKPAGTLHTDHYGNRGATLLQIELKSEDLMPALSWNWNHGDRSVRPFLLLARLFTAKTHSEDLEDAAKCVLANLSPSVFSRRAPLWLRHVRRIIAEQRLVRVKDLAKKMGVHPVYLTRRFRQHFGENIRTFIRRRRIHAAANRLAASRLPLIHIACDLGYSDQAHFCREFLKATGVRPSEFRQICNRID